MKIAVIGATGFVGSHITNELIDRNLHVVAISRKGNQSDKKRPIVDAGKLKGCPLR